MWKKALPLLFLALVADAQYTISTFAGGRGAVVGQSVATYGLDQPYAVAVDSVGNLYISLPLWNQVWVVNSSGTLVQVVGNGTEGFSGDNGPAASAQLWSPYGVAVDSSGNLYIADYGNSRVRKVSGGIITTVAGNGSYGYSGDGGSATSAALFDPFGVAVDNSGSLYIADYGNYRIRKVSGGIITTVAGNGTPGFSGDGGIATSAELGEAQGIAVDGSGNLYIADLGNQRIRKVSGGIIITVAGNGVEGYSGDGGSATSAELNYPYNVAADNSGNLYIADTFNNVVRKVSGGVIATVAGDGIQGFAGDGGRAVSAELNSPNVTVDSSGEIYIADSVNNRIRRVSGGIITTYLGNGLPYGGDGGAATSATLFAPGGSAMDGSGNLFIADTDDCVVRKVALGIISTVAGNGTCGFSGDGGAAVSAELYYPDAVAVDNAGNLYIADTFNNVVRKVSGGTITTAVGTGVFGYSGDGGSATSAQLSYPVGVAVDSFGNLYIADSYNDRIREVSRGIITTVAGNGFFGFSGDGGSATSAELDFPEGVAVDSSGNLYIADAGNSRIRKVSDGIIATVAGNGNFGFSGDGGSATSAALNGAVGVAADSSGNFYIAEGDNERLRKVSGGIITTIAGNGTGGFSGDGGSATSAQLSYPVGVAVDSSGNLYIADMDNNRIRKLTPNSTIGVTATISGPVQDGVVISVTGTITTSCTTSGGSCTLGLTAGGTYTLTPSLAGYFFSPASTTVSNLSESQTVSFISVIQTYTVTASVSGAVQSGVVVYVSGTIATTCTTNGSGSCSLTLIGGGNYTLTPVLSGYTFSPASATFINLSANQTANFSEGVFTVSGTVSGAVKSGVTINVTGSTTTSATTNATGSYSIALAANGTYTLSASLSGYSFSAPVTFSNLSANQTANFTSIAVTNDCEGMFSNATSLVCSAISQGAFQGSLAESIGALTTYYGAMTLVGNVAGGDAAGMAVYNAGGGGGASVSLDLYNTAANGGIPQAKIKAIDDGNYSDNLTFWAKTPGSASNAVTEKVRISSTGSVGIGTTNPTLGPLQMGSGAYVSAGGVWTNASDRNLKENFTPVVPSVILRQIDALPVTEWNYINEDPSVRHIGPVAQDFYSIFGVGNSSTSISTIDPSGIALAGIQGLDEKSQARAAQIAALKKELEVKTEELRALQERLARLEALRER